MTRGISDFRAERERAGSLAAQAGAWIAALDTAEREDPAIWISRFSADEIFARAAELDARGEEALPLFGIPFAVKDNIDVAGLPTTAACPAFSYRPESDAPVVRALLDAGAVCIGKTNLDQFATGLVGVRSPYGIPKNPRAPGFIPGGSSSGSAVAVARGLVPIALGTDTAGSGRVPAAFNGICGWKPTRGLLSARGVVPACRSLDCVSVFAAVPADLGEVFPLLARFDPGDEWSRRDPGDVSGPIRRAAIPLPGELEFFGDRGYAECWRAAVGRIAALGIEIEEVSFAPFFEAARLLYGGPWVAERYLATKGLLETRPEEILPVTREILLGGKRSLATDAFDAAYRLARLKREGEAVFERADALILPTAPTIYTPEEIAAKPIERNSNLGFYTNFFNLLDLCGIAVPAGQRPDGAPFGITLAAPAFRDRALLRFAGAPLDEPGIMEIAVCGAHMRGLPLERQMRALGAGFVREDLTAPEYRLFELDELRPGLLRVGEGGVPIALEIWTMPRRSFGELLASIPHPLGLGKVQLAAGGAVCGFLCEAEGVRGKRDISGFGGWRVWLARKPRETTASPAV